LKTGLSAWKWFFLLAALEAGAAFVALQLIPRESGGYSGARLAVLLALAACALATAYLAFRASVWFPALAQPRYLWLSSSLAIISSMALFLLRYGTPDRLLPYYVRLVPLLLYTTLVGSEFTLWGLWLRNGVHVEALTADRSKWRAAIIALSALLLVSVFVTITRIGVTPDSAYWGEPGVPILGWQLAIALSAGAVSVLLGLRSRSSEYSHWAVPLGIWALAVVVWLSVPMVVMKNSFYAPMGLPANVPFPNSDAGYYDSMAESLLIGYPYQGVIPTRPLYVVFLAFLHLLFGESFSGLLAGQTVVLALIPVVLYYLGRKLHSRGAGVIVALLAIFREWNTLLVSSQTRVSNTRTLLVDLPTTLLLLSACLFVVRWVQRRGRTDALVSGGLMGLLLLLRTQSLLLIPMVLAVWMLTVGLRRREAWISSGVFLMGLAAAIVPWLVHNYLQSGHVILDAPFQYQVIASQYKYTGNLDLGAVDLSGKGIFGILLAFALADPGFVAGFIATHFLATLIDSLLALPLLVPYNGLFEPINLYWMDWQAHLSLANILVLLVYLVIGSIGLSAAWRRLRWAGLVPLFFTIVYALANGIGRFSGWRYDLPADWVAYFYVGIGTAESLGMLALLFGANAPRADPDSGMSTPSSLAPRNAASILLSMAFLGSLAWMGEGLAAPRYAQDTLPVLMQKLQSSAAIQQLHIDGTQIEAFASDPRSTLQTGRILYPRFFSRGDGLASAHPWPAYAPREFPRIGFLLLNQSRHDVLMPIRDVPDVFPHAADAIVLGCQKEDYIEVRLILFPGIDRAYLSAPLSEPCN
jgi:hypothetical protein